ncbi:MAG: winged helix-turn-helix transcriptional regulator [Bacteroidetes bacterium]|nr:winged helix-turn-helix transcriptional regulator [Bacteroidota bacterium]
MRRDTFQAIADPTRREILNMLAYKSLNVNAVSENFNVSRTAVYKHIKILTECGLVVIKQYGRERFCEARLQKLNEVSDWIEQYKKFWNEKLDSLETYLFELQATPSKKKEKKVYTKTKNKLIPKKKSK